MSNAPVENTPIPAPPHRMRNGHRHTSTQSVAKKLAHFEAQTHGFTNGTPSTLDEVTFIRLPEVKAVTGLSKTTIYELIRLKNFPAPVRLGPRAVAWVKSEVRQWAVARVHSRSAA